ncbi:hypothetical protein [Vibrio genomosp. F10]|uniref:hypothetical protein n=1 Tax=Vibrio genomosp. F10 TaxID=723171 RepID=UPI0002FBAABF|nr:hypothetical protein [Vibrio genomosp. F10]OEF06544.1 hypothetical protein A1QK_08055 [Vibrio genomosp. F10 str. 9ZD137]
MIKWFNSYSVLSLVVLLVSSSVNAYQSGNYPKFATAKLFSSGEAVNAKRNVVAYAIENGNAIDLQFNSEFLGARKFLFPEKNFGSSYNVEKVASQAFITATSEVISKFICAEYRFRNRLPSATDCNGFSLDENKREGMPFVSGQFTSSRIEANLDDRANGVSFHIYLKSSQETPLSSAFGSVHELGTFFGGFSGRKNLILSVTLDAYWWSKDTQRSEVINAQPEVYFIVLPSSSELSKAANQKQSAKLGLEKAKILIIGQR